LFHECVHLELIVLLIGSMSFHQNVVWMAKRGQRRQYVWIHSIDEADHWAIHEFKGRSMKEKHEEWNH
jgi:hypothetical protein